MLYLVNAYYTAANTLLGFGLSVIIGFALAVGIVYSRFLEATVYTTLVAVNSMPKVALAPLFVVWMGTGNTSKIAMAFYDRDLCDRDRCGARAAHIGYRNYRPRKIDALARP